MSTQRFVRTGMSLLAALAWLSWTAPASAQTAAPAVPSRQEAAPAPAGSLVEAARRVFAAMEPELARGTRSVEELYRWSCRWRDAELAATRERALGAAESAGAVGLDEHLAAAKAHLVRLRALEATMDLKVRQGLARTSELLAARFFVAEATRAAAPMP